LVAHFPEDICKNHMHQNVDKENKNRPVSGFFIKIAYVQVMNFIPVKVSTLYRGYFTSDNEPDGIENPQYTET
jgi:hypothetical protein